MTNINELFQNYGITGIPAIDTIILAHIIPIIMTYVSLMFGFIKNFVTTIISGKIENFCNNMKRKMFGSIDMRLCISQDKSIYPIIRSILFSSNVVSDITDQKTLGILAMITESKNEFINFTDSYTNIYDLYLDHSNNIVVEKNIDCGSAVFKKYFRFQNYYIVVSENKKTDFKHFYENGFYRNKLHDEEKNKNDNDSSKDNKEYFILFEAIKISKNIPKDDNIIRKFLDERFKLNIRIPHKYILKVPDGSIANKLDLMARSYKNDDSSMGELMMSDGFDIFLTNPLVKEFYNYVGGTNQTKSKKTKGIASSIIIKHNTTSLDLETLGKDISLIDNTSVNNISNFFEPTFKSIISYFFGKKFDLDNIKHYYFYFKNNKIILFAKFRNKTTAITERYIIVISFQEILSRDYTIRILEEILSPHTGKNNNDNTSDNKKIKIVTYNGKWNNVDCESRSYDTIYLPKNTKQLIVSEMDKFICYEKIYRQIGVPYKKGFLLYGPPGTGKTSLVKALAHKYNLPIYIIDINNECVNDDTISTILNSISGTGNRIVLFEDIDSAFADKEKIKYQHRDTNILNEICDSSEEDSIDTKKDSKVIIPNGNNNKKYLTYSGLLNALDGVLTSQHGTIVIMTTNYKDKLGNALIRPGRIDFHVELTYCDRDQLVEMTENIIVKSYNIINAILSSKKNSSNPIKKFIFENSYNQKELNIKINEFADNVMRESQIINSQYCITGPNLSLVKPCELQIYILKYLDKVDDIFNKYQELLPKNICGDNYWSP